MTSIGTFVILSTAHLSPGVSQAMSDKGPDADRPSMTGTWLDDVTICEFACGHWVRVPRAASADPSDMAAHEDAMSGLPECLATCIRHARRYGARWILFDRDEEPLGELPVHHW